MYVSGLSTTRRTALRTELEELLDEYSGKKGKGLRNAWLRLGAQWWDREADLRATLREWIDEL